MDKGSKPKSAKSLSLFGFFAITASMVMASYEYPTFATSGFTLVFYLLAGGFLWFIPVALCAAEMATVEGWQEGGVFAWVGNTLGERYGFAAIAFQFFEISIGFITMLYFILGALSYVFDFPALNTDPTVKFIGVLIVFWALTFTQLAGTKYTAKIAKTGFIIGIVIPSLILFGLAIAYIAQGNPMDVKISAGTFFPDFTKLNTLVVFVSFILGYMGVEASATHANEMKNPKRDYPLAMLILVVVAIILDTMGGLSVAAVIPQSELNLSSGVIQTFAALIGHFTSHGTWIVKIISLMIAVGVMGEVSSWVVGPSRGLYVAAQKGILPKVFRKVNKHNVPVPLIMVQGILCTIWAAVLTFGGGGNNVSFLTAMSLTVVVYLVGYFLFFIAYFNLVLKKKNLKRAYQIPGGTVFKMIVSIVGFIMSIFAFVISFVPPASLDAASAKQYEAMLIICFIIVLILPFAIYALHDKSAHKSLKEPVALKADEVNKFVPPIARGQHQINPDPEDIMDQEEKLLPPGDSSGNKK
ncbi:glutamate:gamma-aminobutyrate antiporter [Clostridium sardiniense]|uniref:Glutamate/gamma-aminobutyrate antiporter n=1 Tax=Clostridium sardiniense TaxID=29369 RepID=A0ABS7L371_CLOSR|nr:glutamate:gamma-aminobutyrate antiporter [Clostridium sardiniense]MBY0757142.1 glutamate:gamma-aminobutyrate antiporter [Clostridium sardiniense]MDQ0461400.1 glutamate:gamma-aminobutyrate antiporter [Clostridium sardiniense]